MKSFCFIMLWSPSNISARVSRPPTVTGVGGYSRAIAMKRTETTTVATPSAVSMPRMPMEASRMGVTIIPASTPR